MKLWLLARLETFFEWLEDWAREMRQRTSYCPDCGRNRYTGPACKNLR